MIVRSMRRTDRVQADRIYNAFFSDNEYPDFFDRGVFECPFVIANNDDKVIVAGGVKTIVEAVVVSDQDISSTVRLDALIQALGSVITIANDMKRKQVHVFVHDDENYVKVLQKFGFKLLDAKVLVLDLGESHG